MAFNCVERVKFYATQLPQELLRTSISESFHSEIYGCFSDWMATIHIPSRFHPYSMQIPMFFLQHELKTIGNMNGEKEYWMNIWSFSIPDSIQNPDDPDVIFPLETARDELRLPQEASGITEIRPAPGWPSRGILEAGFSVSHWGW